MERAERGENRQFAIDTSQVMLGRAHGNVHAVSDLLHSQASGPKIDGFTLTGTKDHGGGFNNDQRVAQLGIVRI